MNEEWQAGNPVALTQTMFKSALVRRVSIYLVLSSAAVGVVNTLNIEEQNSYQIYIPLFIAIYIFSRWVDSRFSKTTIKQNINLKQDQPMTGKGFGESEQDSLNQLDRSTRE